MARPADDQLTQGSHDLGPLNRNAEFGAIPCYFRQDDLIHVFEVVTHRVQDHPAD